MKFSLIVTLLMVVIPRSVLAQLTPASPINPTEYGQCRALYNSWQIVRTEAQTKHDDCLKKNNAYMREWHEKKDETCVIGECQQWHGSWWWGRDEVKECEDEVTAYLKEKAKEEKKEKEAEEERADAEKKAKAAQRKAYEDTRKENEQKARPTKEPRESDEAAKASRAEDAIERENARRQGDAARQAEQQERRDRAARADNLSIAEQASDALQKRIQKNYEEREAEAAALASKSADNRSAVSAIVNGTKVLVAAAIGGMDGALGEVEDIVKASAKASDFDIPTDGEKLKSAADQAWAKLGSLVPFAGIPFAIVTNIAVKTADLSDQLTRTIANFEQADPAELEAAFAEFPQKAYGIRPVVDAIVNHIGGQLRGQFDSLIVTPATEELAARIRLSVKNRDASALLGEVEAPQGSVAFSWEARSSTSSTKTLRDHNGTVMLFDRSGKPYKYDASLERATYNASDVEGLIANSDLSVRRSRPVEWTRKAVIINPLQITPDPSFEEKLIKKAFKKWVAGPYTASLFDPLKISDETWEQMEQKQ